LQTTAENTAHPTNLAATSTIPSTLTPTATSTPPNPIIIPPRVIAEIEGYFEDWENKSLFSGVVLIAQHGNILLSQGYGMADRQQNIPNTPQTCFRIASLTKQFTAMTILILEEQGKLTVQDLICSYITNCPKAWEEITIHHLLTHSSGIPNLTSLPGYRSSRSTPSAPLETIARFKDLALNFPPGEKFSYSNSGYILLGYIIEQVSSKPYEEVLQEVIFSPLKLKNTGYDHNANELAVGYSSMVSSLPADYIDMTIPFSAYALYSTVEDLYRWEQALYTEQLLSKTYLDQMFTQQLLLPDNPVLGYGYGWLIWKGPGPRSAFHFGSIEGFASYIARYPDDRITIILLSNIQNATFDTIIDILHKKIFGEE
jgi:CubicO group peptidase (beta-lactamase class C family)